MGIRRRGIRCSITMNVKDFARRGEKIRRGNDKYPHLYLDLREYPEYTPNKLFTGPPIRKVYQYRILYIY